MFLSLLLFVFEQCGKRIKAEVPARGACIHPSLGFFQAVGSSPDEMPPAFASPRDKSCLLQNPKMPGNGRRRYTERSGQFRDRCFRGLRKPQENTAPGRIGKGGEYGRRLSLIVNQSVKYSRPSCYGRQGRERLVTVGVEDWPEADEFDCRRSKRLPEWAVGWGAADRHHGFRPGIRIRTGLPIRRRHNGATPD